MLKGLFDSSYECKLMGWSDSIFRSSSVKEYSMLSSETLTLKGLLVCLASYLSILDEWENIF